MNCRSILLGLVNSKVEFQFTLFVKSVQHFDLVGVGGVGEEIVKGGFTLQLTFHKAIIFYTRLYPLEYFVDLLIACKHITMYFVSSEIGYFSWRISWFSSLSQDLGPPPYIYNILRLSQSQPVFLCALQ